jgi:cyclophilin family peptidyl-prolyl cis-trans isomerase
VQEGLINFNLYDNVVPKTTRNFRELCTGQNGFGYKYEEVPRLRDADDRSQPSLRALAQAAN